MHELPIPASSLTAPDHPLCGLCNQPAKGYCKGCRNMWHCSKACKEKDAPLHSSLCKSFRDLEPRPASHNDISHHRAIYFPVSESAPCFVWLAHHHQASSTTPQQAAVEALIGGKYESYMSFDCHHELRRRLGYRVEISCGADVARDGSVPNRALRELLPGPSAERWAGSFLAWGRVEMGDAPVDLDTSALPAILACLGWLGR
ncbi:hypothetical protein EJ07DRAFT_154039 [Lizonia empirigonia]|nr:hypothetical protein EJ07DRAFT_154039 [Lizonia empirigonia]